MKYSAQYVMPPKVDYSFLNKEFPTKAPVWCSVDLRDGNQSLIIPMSIDEKIEFYKMLIKVGFKEIEIGFPAASETEYQLLRRLIEEDLIPPDVTVQVLTQAREHIIRRTFEALDGCERAIVHVYNSTSIAQREQVFQKSKAEIKQIAIEGAQLLKELTGDRPYRFEYSRARLCARSLQRRSRRVATDCRSKGDYQHSRDGRTVDAARVRSADRLHQ